MSAVINNSRALPFPINWTNRLRPRVTGDQAQLHFGLTELHCRMRYASDRPWPVRNLAQRESVYGCDDRLGAALHGIEDFMSGSTQGLTLFDAVGRKFGDVGTGDKCLAPHPSG